MNELDELYFWHHFFVGMVESEKEYPWLQELEITLSDLALAIVGKSGIRENDQEIQKMRIETITADND